MASSDQMQFAKIVKEGFETTVLPVPLNALEHLVNRLAPYGRVEEGRTSLNWYILRARVGCGAFEHRVVLMTHQYRSLSHFNCDFVLRLDRGRHYTWPASSLPYQLEMAMRKVQVKNEGDKAARKVREGSDKI